MQHLSPTQLVSWKIYCKKAKFSQFAVIIGFYITENLETPK